MSVTSSSTGEGSGSLGASGAGASTIAAAVGVGSTASSALSFSALTTVGVSVTLTCSTAVASMSERVGGVGSGTRVSLTATGVRVSSLTMSASTTSFSATGPSTTMAGGFSALGTSIKGATSTLNSVVGASVTGAGPGSGTSKADTTVVEPSMAAKTSAGAGVAPFPSALSSALFRGAAICCGTRTTDGTGAASVVAGMASVVAEVAFGSAINSVAIGDSG